MKRTIIFAFWVVTTTAWAEAARPEVKPAQAKGRQATISLWGGYTPYVGAVDRDSYKSACEVYTSAGGSCENKLGGFAGGIDLWMGNVAQLGFAAQYFQAANLDGSSTRTVTTVIPPTTTTLKTVEKLNSQFIPLLAQFRIHPKYFYIGVGAGVAINITNYEFTVNGNGVSGRKTSNPTGFFAQATLGIALPLGDDVSLDAFVKGSLLTVFYEAYKDANGNYTYQSAAAWAVTPGLAFSLHF
ncbi:MAG: hypothetical protein U1F16_16815 [Turneriella sp.]